MSTWLRMKLIDGHTVSLLPSMVPIHVNMSSPFGKAEIPLLSLDIMSERSSCCKL